MQLRSGRTYYMNINFTEFLFDMKPSEYEQYWWYQYGKKEILCCIGCEEKINLTDIYYTLSNNATLCDNCWT